MATHFFILNRVANDDTTDWRNNMAFVLPDAANGLIEALRQTAENRNLTMISDDPKAGWAAKFKRDGKVWPCGEHTDGAFPVWIWTAR